MGKRILAVDDDVKVLEGLSEFLSGEGFEVATARSGEEASRVIGEGFFPILIIDALAPGACDEGFLALVKGGEPEPR